MSIRRLALLLLLMLAVFSASCGDDDEEELSILTGAPPGTVMTQGPQWTPIPRSSAAPSVTATPAPAYFDSDGSVTITLTCAGDLALGGDPREESAFEEERDRQAKGDGFVLRNVRPLFRGDDLTLLSLRTTLGEADRLPAPASKNRVFRADPSFAAALADGGVELAVAANDHSLDFGAEGLDATLAALRSAGLAVSAEGQLATVTVKSIRVAVLSYNAVGRTERVANALPGDLALVTSLSDVAIVYFHWGAEQSYVPDNDQIMLGRLAAEHGAKLVLGSRSAHINPIEDYHGAYIVYSMGSLCSLAEEKPGDMSAFLFQVRFRFYRGETERHGFRIVPIRIATSTEVNDFCPTPLTKDTAIDSVITTLLANGAPLEFAVQEYPTAWR